MVIFLNSQLLHMTTCEQTWCMINEAIKIFNSLKIEKVLEGYVDDTEIFCTSDAYF